MRKRICLSISILAVSLTLPNTIRAQKLTQAEATDTLKVFKGVSIGVDLLGVGQRALSEYGQYEAFLRVNLLDKYFPIIEVGLGDANITDETTSLCYKASAPYGRVGCDFNLLRNKHDLYRLYAGARIAYSSFKYDVSSTTPIQDPVWGNSTAFGAKDIKASAFWGEVCGGIDVTIWRFVHLGWSLRYRMRLSQSYGTVGEPYYIPGFGRNGNNRIGAVFNLSFEL